jgi:mannose-6-phosphate isomerase-like protein (cupin superfamily)
MPYQPIIKPRQQPAYEAIDSKRILTVLISHDICDAHGVLAGMSLLRPGESSPYDVHPDMEEVFYVISGRGTARIDDNRYPIQGGDVMYVQNGSYHQFIAAGDSSLHLFWAFAAHPDEEFKEKFKKWKPVDWPLEGDSDVR